MHSYNYDDLNRPTKYTDALGNSETYTYNNYGDMEKKVDRNGNTTEYTYDPLHRLIKESVTKDGETSANTYKYSLTGQLVSESNADGTKTYKSYIGNIKNIVDEENITIDGVNHKVVRTYDEGDRPQYFSYYKGDLEKIIDTDATWLNFETVTAYEKAKSCGFKEGSLEFGLVVTDFIIQAERERKSMEMTYDFAMISIASSIVMSNGYARVKTNNKISLSNIKYTDKVKQ